MDGKRRPVGKSNYSPGLVEYDLPSLLPDAVTRGLRAALTQYDKRFMRGYLTADAKLIAVESRTSAPVRILRDKSTLQSSAAEGFFPAGEGAGYAGGIMSASLDGIRVGRAVLQHLNV